MAVMNCNFCNRKKSRRAEDLFIFTSALESLSSPFASCGERAWPWPPAKTRASRPSVLASLYPSSLRRARGRHGHGCGLAIALAGLVVAMVAASSKSKCERAATHEFTGILVAVPSEQARLAAMAPQLSCHSFHPHPLILSPPPTKHETGS